MEGLWSVQWTLLHDLKNVLNLLNVFRGIKQAKDPAPGGPEQHSAGVQQAGAAAFSLHCRSSVQAL